jgi:hypothetical protein
MVEEAVAFAERDASLDEIQFVVRNEAAQESFEAALGVAAQ